MTHTCPHCRKSSPGPAGALFCAFCGERLSAADAHATASLPHDPDRTTDLPTKAYFLDSTAEADPAPAGPPARVAGFRLLRQLGAGGMGTVHEAEADDTGDRVAIKLLSPKLAANPVSVERFKQEGRLASKINHPRCVFVYGADTDGGRPFIVMELMPGSTLKELIDRRGPLPVGEAVARILDVIDGLLEAHRLGVIHRDVKPSNCFVTADDRVKVGDFGLSKSLAGADGDKQLTTSGAFLGTVLFAPPEQIRGEEVGYDSDVYSVCATLYYLLTGRAPYQHESLTAALAKAISEPPPPVRSHRPEVSRGLEKVILRGLERDRNRRWDSLEDLRDALAEQLPGAQIPARRRALVAAFLLDSVILFLLVQLPIQLIEAAAIGRRVIGLGGGSGFDVTIWLPALAYFTLAEGLFGTTPGKWLLRLRVSKVGQVGPPGLRAAAVRSGAFGLLLFATLVLTDLLHDLPYVGVPLELAVSLAGLAALAMQLRPSWRSRGLHDRASGCEVVQRTRPPHRVRLVARGPNPLDRAVACTPPLPAVVGGFAVKGRLRGAAGGPMVWAAEDKSLGRRIFLWVRPPGDGANDPPPPADRPTRVRAVSAGELVWNGGAYGWVAFVAPAGAPLVDVVDPTRPLPWPDARMLLEQVADELIAAAEEGTLPPRLGADQLWAEPSGRLHLLEFPVPTTAPVPPPAADGVGLLRQVTTLLLEGQARGDGGRVAAPLPPHAAKITDRLFSAADPFPDVPAVRVALAGCHQFPPRTTGAMRAAHVGLTAMMTAVMLGVLLTLVLAINLWSAVFLATQLAGAEATKNALRNDAFVRKMAADPDLTDYLTPERLPETDRRLAALVGVLRDAADEQGRTLTRPERYVLSKMDFAEGPGEGVSHELARAFLVTAQFDARRGVYVTVLRQMIYNAVLIVAGVFLAGCVAFAFVFRGGVSYVLAGLTLVRRDGCPAGRVRCAARELVAWLPLVAVLISAAWVQETWPGWGFGRAAAAAGCVTALVAGAITAVRFPERGLADRIAGTVVVPV